MANEWLLNGQLLVYEGLIVGCYCKPTALFIAMIPMVSAVFQLAAAKPENSPDRIGEKRERQDWLPRAGHKPTKPIPR